MGLLLPALDDDSRGFWEGCALGEIRVQRCERCGSRRFPPRPMCPVCRSLEVSWDPIPDEGTIWSFVVVHPPLLPAYGELAPYNVVVVALDVDPTLRLVGNLVAAAEGDIGEIDPDTIEIGEPVTPVFAPVGDDPDIGTIALPRWVRRASHR
jgi:uncharacterized OB-fold protein